MAKIRTLENSSQTIAPHRSQVDATFQFISDDNGEPIFHLSTYGSDDRKLGPKVSQTFQLDFKTARKLVSQLRYCFGDDVIASD
jgi:hypothetical protein